MTQQIFRRVLISWVALTVFLAPLLNVHAQSMLLMGAGKGSAGGGGGCSEATSFLARTSGLDATHQTRYTTLICGLVTDSIWSKLDTLYIFATDTTTNAALNLKSATYNGTVNGTLTFAADVGWTGNASTGYLATGLNPSVGGMNYVRDSAHVGVYVRTSRTTDVVYIEIGSSDGVPYTRLLNFFGGSGYYSVNGTQIAVNTVNAQGLWIISRTSSTAVELYKNGSSFDTASDTSSAPENVPIHVFAEGQSGGGAANHTGDQLSAAFIGSGLTDTDVTNLSARLNTYMTAYGINVY